MNFFLTEFFTNSTAEDESNYFYSDAHQTPVKSEREYDPIPPGQYRIINGNMCKIASGLPIEDVRAYVQAAINR